MNNEEKKEQLTGEGKKADSEKSCLREIIIATDGNKIQIRKNELAGKLELSALLTQLLNNIDKF